MADVPTDEIADLSLGEPANYTAPKRKSVTDILEAQEGEDEALQRYKASLLGAAAAGGAAADDPRRVVITELSILVNGRETLTYNESDIAGDLNIVLKEGCEYKTQLSFRVQNDIVSGLKYCNSVSRIIPVVGKPLNVLIVDEMLGSYGPDPSKVITVVFPRREWEQAPSGMVARATYTANTTLVDDDGTVHLAFDYKLNIKKDWE